MRNPWNDDLPRAPVACRNCKTRGFSLRTAVLIVIGNAVMITAAHALAGGFGRVLGTAHDEAVPVAIRTPDVTSDSVAPPVPFESSLLPAWNVPIPPAGFAPVPLVEFE